MSTQPNAARYRHIATDEIIKLFDRGMSHSQIAKELRMGPCAVGTRLRKAGKMRRPAKLTLSQLKECRRDPAWEARPGNRGIVPADRIVCRKCGELKAEINANGVHSHLRKHRVTADDYKRKYPGARLTSFFRSVDQSRRQGRTKTIQVSMTEFAARQLTPAELKKYRRDQEYEERHGITEFVACRLCGVKSKTDLGVHLKRMHALTSKGYRARFPKCLQLPLGLYDAKNKKQKERQRDRWTIVRAQLAKIKNGELVPKPVSPGRPKLAPKETRAFEVGSAVEDFIPKAEMALKIIAGLPQRERTNIETLRATLAPLGFVTEAELRLAQFERTPKRLARSIVAGRLPMSLKAVERCHQRYLQIRSGG